MEEMHEMEPRVRDPSTFKFKFQLRYSHQQAYNSQLSVCLWTSHRVLPGWCVAGKIVLRVQKP
jgi:hypothetical protein